MTAIEGGFREVRSGGGDGLEIEICVLVSGNSVRRQSGTRRRRIRHVLASCLMYARVRVLHLFVLVQLSVNRRFLRGLRHGSRRVVPTEQTERCESCCHDKVEPNPR